MATFSFNKKVGEIEKRELLPDDWYLVRIVKEPKVMPNAKKRNGLSEADGAGDNIVVSLRVQSHNPKYNGRPFTKWLPTPKPSDSENINEFSGLTVEDEKLTRISQWAAAFGGVQVDDLSKKKNLDLDAGTEAQVYIIQQLDGREGHEDDMVNSIDFNQPPRPAE